MELGASPEDICKTPLAYLMGTLFVEVTQALDELEIESDELMMQVHQSAVTNLISWMNNVSPKRMRKSKWEFWLKATFHDLTTVKWKPADQ